MVAKGRWLFERQEEAALAEVEAARIIEEAEPEDEDEPKEKRKPSKPQQVHVWTLPDWKNPYGSDHKHRPYPQASQAQRLASVMRVIGHPLSVMKKWPEVVVMQGAQVGIPDEARKAKDMAEQKAVAAHRAALEKSIEKLATRRDIVKAELDELEGELKLLLSMLKAAGGGLQAPIDPTDSKPAKGKKPPAKAKPGKVLSKKEINELARSMLSKASLTADALAEATGQTSKNAAQTLARLARSGDAVRQSRGVYGAA